MLFRPCLGPLDPGVHPRGQNIAYDLALVKLGPIPNLVQQCVFLHWTHTDLPLYLRWPHIMYILICEGFLLHSLRYVLDIKKYGINSMYKWVTRCLHRMEQNDMAELLDICFSVLFRSRTFWTSRNTFHHWIDSFFPVLIQIIPHP